MRILHISNNYTPYSGGVVSALNALIPALQKAGHAVRLITLDFQHIEKKDAWWVYRIPSFFTVTYKKNILAVPCAPTHYINEKIISFKPDIIHVHHPFLLGAIAKKLAKKWNIPCVFTYHTMYEQYAHYSPVAHQITQYVISKKVTSFCKDLAAIIVPSKGIINQLAARIDPSSLHLIASPLQSHFFNNMGEKKQNTVLKLLYVGRFVPEKNVKALIDLFASLEKNKYILTLVGYGMEEDFLKERAYKYHQLSPSALQFVIKPPPSLLRTLYQESDLFLFPSHTDTQGLVLAEAMAAGLPVIAFPGAGQQDIITQGINGFIANDSQEMHEYIDKIRNDYALLKTLSFNAHATSNQFLPQTIVQQVSALYKKLIL